MLRLPRRIPAIVLVVLYAMIVLSPLGPMTMYSPVIAHAVTGECVSDCSICGCSPERSANHTCCCWQKKRLHEHEADQDEPECCRKEPHGENAPFTISTCPSGDNKILALFGVGQSELLPYLFSPDKVVIFEASLNTHILACQSDWPGDPPDPPPKLTHAT